MSNSEKIIRKDDTTIQEIFQNDRGIQNLFLKLKNTPTLAAMVLVGLQLGCLFVVKIIEIVLEERASRICHWPTCPKCGARIENKGREDRRIKCLIGIVKWKRKVGRCPNGCEIGQIAPLDEELGLKPHQRTGEELKRVACALAVFVPYQVSSTLLSILTGVFVSDQTIWIWVQEFGRKAKEKLQQQIEAMQNGELIEPELIDPLISQLPLIIGADGVLAPFRPEVGSPKGQRVWKEVKRLVFLLVSNDI